MDEHDRRARTDIHDVDVGPVEAAHRGTREIERSQYVVSVGVRPSTKVAGCHDLGRPQGPTDRGHRGARVGKAFGRSS